jgi:acetyl-CoA acetyltransferase
MDVAACYDDFTPTALSSLEAFGYCERGTGWEFIRDGRIEAGGEIPLNTSGGHTSESYMQGWNHIAELIRQIRRQSANQVPGCEYGHYMCYSPIITSLVFARS